MPPDPAKIAALQILFDGVPPEEIRATINAATNSPLCLTTLDIQRLKEARAHLDAVQNYITETLREFGEAPIGRLKCDTLKNSLSRADGRAQSAKHHITNILGTS